MDTLTIVSLTAPLEVISPADERTLFVPDEEYYLSGDNMSTIITELKRSSDDDGYMYNSLDLGYCQIDGSGFAVLNDFLRENDFVKFFHVRDHRFTDDQLDNLSLSMEVTKVISRITITFSRMKDFSIYFMRRYLCNLTHLNLNNASLADRGCDILLKHVDTTKLVSLDLSCNELGEKSVKLIKEYCGKTSVLINLNISHNLKIGGSGVTLGLSILGVSTSLERLGLWSISTRDAHITQLSNILAHNTVIQYIDIGSSFEADGYILMEELVLSRQDIHFQESEYILEVADRVRKNRNK